MEGQGGSFTSKRRSGNSEVNHRVKISDNPSAKAEPICFYQQKINVTGKIPLTVGKAASLLEKISSGFVFLCLYSDFVLKN